jgi:NAD(P)-dependent dehydrogenase (short-subunit alcohol dehydrogenase family)
MELHDKVVVITGAASGIGRAMALRFAEEGARGVVVSDIDPDGAAAVAAELEQGLAVACDVADQAQMADLIERSEAAFGPIDLFCANAGVGGGTDLDTPDEQWDAAFDVNVRSHIVAARLLVPGWVERGGGYFLSTASAAGLLGVIGSAPYPVTKHAAVAFAEWLAITYGDRGVRVSCLCPMGVRTQLLEDGMALPGEAGAGLRLTNAAGPLLDPAEVADAAVAGLADERFLILPHPEVQDFVLGKAADREGWLARMRGLRAQAAAAIS